MEFSVGDDTEKSPGPVSTLVEGIVPRSKLVLASLLAPRNYLSSGKSAANFLNSRKSVLCHRRWVVVFALLEG
jgi:hypothetical protein